MYRNDRTAEDIRREITAVIRELKDPRVKDKLLTVVRIVPLTSPFIMPADILIGNMTIIEALSSILVLVVSSLGLIIVTGKIYKGKIFDVNIIETPDDSHKFAILKAREEKPSENKENI